MPRVNFRTSDFRRRVADTGSLTLRNRYFEQNPFLTDDDVSLLARPGLKRLRQVGAGPIRGMASEAGAFEGDLFVASGETLHRVTSTLEETTVFSGLFDPERGFVNMAITAPIGDGPDATPSFLFVADGRNLLVYRDTPAPTVTAVVMPDDIGAIDVAVINSYVIVIPRQIRGQQGRFYWIEPGETTLDPNNYATAERSPDGIYGVQVFGDQFWLPGQTSTEVWYPTGDLNVPMRRLQGVVFDRGAWLNTAKAVHETMVVVDADGGVFLIRGGSPQRVSTPDIEEEIRRAISTQINMTV